MNTPWEVIENSWPDADHIPLQDNLSGQICDKMRYPRHAIRQEGRKAAGFPQVRAARPQRGFQREAAIQLVDWPKTTTPFGVFWPGFRSSLLYLSVS